MGVGGDSARSQFVDLHPLGHFGAPSNVADAIVFLASDKAAFMTGSEVVVDGGVDGAVTGTLQNRFTGRVPALPRRHKYTVLLALLLASIVSQTSGLRSDFAGILSDSFRTVLVVTIFFVVFHGTRERLPAVLLLLVTVTVGWTRHFTGASNDGGLAMAFNALLALFLWTAVAVILRDLFRTPGAGNVLGAICGFLIAADAWSCINICAYMLAPQSFAFNSGVQELLAHWHGRAALFCYYSFAQMTTLGYADITPVRAPATTLSLFAALFGMFYTAIVVAQLVGLARREKGDAAPGDGEQKHQP